MKRYERLIYEVGEGIEFEVLEGKKGELIIRFQNIKKENVYSGNYVNPPVPRGFKYVEGKWNDGFVIKSCSGNQFVWIPVWYLDTNGTLDGLSFTEKFGRRNFGHKGLSE